MTLSKLLRCCTCNVCASRQYIYTEGNNGNINESLEPCNNHTFNSLFSDPFSNSEADEFRKYSFCKENHRYKLSFKLSKSTEQKIDRMCKYTEHLDRQDLCRISLYPRQQNKQCPGYKYLHIYSLFAGKQERSVPESRHFCDH
jgi:hypothetical protein